MDTAYPNVVSYAIGVHRRWVFDHHPGDATDADLASILGSLTVPPAPSLYDAIRRELRFSGHPLDGSAWRNADQDGHEQWASTVERLIGGA